MNASKHIVIKRSELRPSIGKAVSEVIGWRGLKATNTAAGAQIGGYGSTIPAVSPFVTEMPIGQKVGAVMTILLAGTAAGALAGYRSALGGQDKALAEMERHIKEETHLDTRRTHEVAKLRKTHPLFLVNRKGDLVLVPKTTVQRALKRASETFLKGLVRARKEL